MARLKTEYTQAVEQRKCPTCQSEPGTHCVNVKSGKRASLHRARIDLMCKATLLGEFFCARPANHRSGRHQTLDGRVDWSKELDEEPQQAAEVPSAENLALAAS